MINSILTVLCGGQSRRMQQDKALLMLEGEPLIQRHIRLAQQAHYRVQIASASSHYHLPEDVTYVQDKLPNQQGPLSALAGALTAAASQGAQGTFLMPVDTLISPITIVATLREKCPAPAVIIVRDGRPQPLFAWYSVELIPRIESWLHTGIRRMMPLAALDNARYITMPNTWQSIDNFNTPEEWQTALTTYQKEHS